MLSDALADEVEEREAEKKRLRALEEREKAEKAKVVAKVEKEKEEMIYHF